MGRRTKNPSIEALEDMADLYGVSTDYLLGRTNKVEALSKQALTPQELFVMNGNPVWFSFHGWMLVHSSMHTLLKADGASIPFSDVGDIFIYPPLFTCGVNLQL